MKSVILSVSVIIPVYRDWDRLAHCLDALERQTLAGDRFEIIVANNEQEASCPLTRLPGNCRVIHEPRPGSYAARNAAVSVSAGRYLAFTDSDCVPEPDWLERGVAALEAHPGARVAGAVEIFRQPGSGRYGYLYDRQTAFPQRTYAAAGLCATANLMVPRVAFDAVGPFDECFSGGDFEWNKRAQTAGIPIVFDETVRVGHPARSLPEIFRKRRRKAGSRIDTPVHRFVLGRLRPPVRLVLRLRRNGVGWSGTMTVAAIHWVGCVVEIVEFSLIRLGLKKASRS